MNLIKLSILAYVACLLLGCSTSSFKTHSDKSAGSLDLGTIKGNQNIEIYRTQSKIKVTDLSLNKVMEDKLERGEFKLLRETLAVNDEDKVHFRYWVTDKKGEVDLLDMALPPVGKNLFEVVNKKAEVIAVKGFPEESLFYIPKISLPSKEVKIGDSWDYNGRWRGLETGWPFEISITSTLKNWVSCGGRRCAHINYVGKVILPKDSPLKDGTLESEITGSIIYSPIGHQFIWVESFSKEMFKTSEKKIEVKSCTISYQELPNVSDTKKLSKQMKKKCF